MGGSRHERSERLAAQVAELTPEKRGELVLYLFGTSLLAVAMETAWVALLLRAGLAVRRHGEYQPGAVLRTAWSLPLGVLTAVVVAQQLSIPLLGRKLERWVAAEVDARQRE